ncbi:MAG: response regulator [Acidobacteria bacterium]|nr:response regulator [Acidobacteriota bacterium]
MRRILSRFPTSTLMGLAFTIPAMLIAGFLLFYHTMEARAFLADEGVRYGDMLADQLLSASQRFMRLGSPAAVQEVIEETGSKRSVVYIALIGKDGRVIAASKRDWIGHDATIIPDPDFTAIAAAARDTARAQHRLVDDGRRLILVSPLLLEGVNPSLSNLGGLLCLKVNQERQLSAMYAEILERGVVSALGILLVSLMLLFWVRAILAQPLLRVAAFVRAFAKGAPGPPPPSAGTLEVAQLTEDVGRMAGDLEEKQAALAASVERHRRLLEGAYDAILTADPETGRLLEVNAMFCRLFGYTAEETRALTLRDLHPQEERDRLMQAYRAASGGGHGGFHGIPCVRRNGERFLVDVRGGPISLGNRTVTEWILRDTTERRNLEDQLRQAQKMESVGTLAGGIAHDFNNLLTGILGYTRLVKIRLPAEDPNRRKLDLIEKSALRAAELTAQLLTFSRRAATRPAPADLNETVARVVEGLRPKLPPVVELVFERGHDLWTASVDTEQVEQVLLHLCANAREAMPEGGRLTIATTNRTLTRADCQGNLEARPGRFVTLTVRDTGRGIQPAVLARIFEPFFTTKELGKGAGMGLAMVHGAVKGHDGWIEVGGEPGRGAWFTVHFPVYDEAAARDRAAVESPAVLLDRLAGVSPQPPAAARPLAGASPPAGVSGVKAPPRTVLAVDDESTVLALARDILEMHGYKVLTARNGEEALHVFRERAATIDLVLLDLTMPVMGGRECFKHLREIDPGVRVLVSSGFSAESTASDMMSEGALAYVQKPYDIDALARIVRQALGA